MTENPPKAVGRARGKLPAKKIAPKIVSPSSEPIEKSAAAQRLPYHTGTCNAATCPKNCQQWEPGQRSQYYQLCLNCTHTQGIHEYTPPEGAAPILDDAEDDDDDPDPAE